MKDVVALAERAVRLCREIAQCSEQAGRTTRTFLSQPMHAVHARLADAMRALGMEARIDAIGNLRGLYAGTQQEKLLIGSHLDTVPDAGAFDGVLGVVLALSLIEMQEGRRLPFAIEVIGFSEEEGVRFGVPFLGSRAVTGSLRTDMLSAEMLRSIEEFGLSAQELPQALIETDCLGYFEMHIEQGPVLEALDLRVSAVEAIAGQSRWQLNWGGSANHAGTTPMHLRRDALAGAAEWVVCVEQIACEVPGLVATVGRIEALPGAGNVIAGTVTCSLDVRHADDAVRQRAVAELLRGAEQIARRRNLTLSPVEKMTQAAVPADASLTAALKDALRDAGEPVHAMVSGAGHDAMVLAEVMPMCMLFLRSPGGVSHHPEETVRTDDVAAALRVANHFLMRLEARQHA